MNPIRNKQSIRNDKISNGVKITIKNYQKKIPVSPKRIKQTILKVLSQERKITSGEITVCLVNDKIIKKLNKEYTGDNRPTDVLAFDITDAKFKKNILADIIISTDTAIRNARVFKTTPLYELYLYIIHGSLHLLGYKDKTTAQRNIMQKKTQKLLTSIPKILTTCPYLKPKPSF